jgi:hypothetical protein
LTEPTVRRARATQKTIGHDGKARPARHGAGSHAAITRSPTLATTTSASDGWFVISMKDDWKRVFASSSDAPTDDLDLAP